MEGFLKVGHHMLDQQILQLKNLSTGRDVGVFTTFEGLVLTCKKGDKPKWSGENLHLLGKSYREARRRRRVFASATPEHPSVLVILALPEEQAKVMRDLRMRGVDPVFVEYGLGWLSAFEFESK
jgi:peroxiredoxin family protein